MQPSNAFRFVLVGKGKRVHVVAETSGRTYCGIGLRLTRSACMPEAGDMPVCTDCQRRYDAIQRSQTPEGAKP